MSARVFAHHGTVGFRAFGWQFDYRPRNAWFPPSVRWGKREWHILRIGPLGFLTAGPVVRIDAGVSS